MKKFNSSNISLLMMLLLAFSLGWLISNLINLNKPEHLIGYIFKDEIINLEKERIMHTGETNLFKGNPALIAKIINEMGRKIENKDMSVIFTVEKIKGVNVQSLSKQVYLESQKIFEQNLLYSKENNNEINKKNDEIIKQFNE